MSTANTRIRFLDLIDEVGISYRQADHWCRKGYVRTRCNGHEVSEGVWVSCSGGGSGHFRIIDDDEVDVLRTMARLVHAGIIPEVAARLARNRTRLTDAVARGLERLSEKAVA